MYIHERSGHHRAAMALEKAMHLVDARAECRLVDALGYTHPILERLIRRTYLEIIRKRPEVWEYLYDNPKVLKNTRKLRRAIHKSHSRKFKKLLDDFQPDAIVCTQAFPCGIVSDYKATYNYATPLYGVLTDYLPHSYWILDPVDRYFVPSEEAKEMLRENGVFEDRICVTGIPIEPLQAPKEKSKERLGAAPMILVMGGSQGIGPIEEIVAALDRLSSDFELIVVTGQNKRLHRRLNRRKKFFKKKTKVYSYMENIVELMRDAHLLISKPGGLTIAQSLALGLPIIFIDPIPGQEAKNASFLLRHRAALQARSAEEVGVFVEQLLSAPAKIEAMKRNMKALAYPDAAIEIAKRVLKREPPH